MTQYVVSGKTYRARIVLREAGFRWDAKNEAWWGDEAARAELDRITTATYSRTNQRDCAGIVISVMGQLPADAESTCPANCSECGISTVHAELGLGHWQCTVCSHHATSRELIG